MLRRLHALALAVTAGLAIASPSLALWVSLVREMTEDERFDFAARAPVIATVRFLRPARPPRSIARSHPLGAWVEVERLGTVRGSVPARFQVGMNAGWAEGTFHTPQGLTGKTAVILLRPSGSTWILNENPYLLGNGVIEVTEATCDSIERRLAAAVERRSLRSLSLRAEFVVRGIALVGHGGYEIENPEVIAGASVPAVLRIDTVLLLDRGVDQLFFLARRPDGRFGILSVDAGRMRIVNGIVEPLDQPVDAVLRQVHLYRLAARSSPVASAASAR